MNGFDDNNLCWTAEKSGVAAAKLPQTVREKNKIRIFFSWAEHGG